MQTVDIIEYAVQDESHNECHIVVISPKKPKQQVAALDEDVDKRDRVGRNVRRNEAYNPGIQVDMEMGA
jgi:hypothetical protein